MTDEQELRELLFRAAELPDSIQPPVQRLIERGRARRARRAVLSAACAAVVVAAVATLPSALGGAVHQAVHQTVTGPAHSGLLGGLPQGGGSGPSAAELSRFRWSALPPSPLGPRSQPLLTWTGKDLIELGGIRKGSTQNDGAAFDATTGRWHRIAQVQGNVGFANGVTAWTGRELFVTNGQVASCPAGVPVTPCLGHAGLYDPAANRWTTSLLPRQMEGLTPTAAVWTGRDIVVGFVGTQGTSGKLGVAAYDPAANRWQVSTPALPLRHPCRYIAMVTTSNRLILWSFWDRTVKHGKHDLQIFSGVDVLTLDQAGHWITLNGIGWPQHQNVETPAFTGDAILVSPGQIWCGDFCSPPGAAMPGSLVNPATLRRMVIPAGPIGQTIPPYIWTGRAIIAVNLYSSGGRPPLRPDDMALYDPATGRWSGLPATPGYPNLAAAPLWAGTQLLALTDSGALWSFHR